MKEIKRFLDERIGKYSFYFEDLNSGYIYAHNENVVMTAAGCIKLPIAMSLLKEVERNKVSLDEKVNINLNDKVYGKGIIHEFSERDYTLNELLIAMLIQSDNTAANKLINVLGTDNINNCFIEMGLNSTKLNKKTVDERLYNSNDKAAQNVSSSEDLSTCWKHLYKSTYLNPENSNKLMDILRRQQVKNKIAFYMPDRVKKELASKPGDLEGVENDTALMTTPKGKFIFTVMSEELPNNIYGNVTITRVGKMAWDIISNNWSNTPIALNL
jgi:beta-lactamase class A